METDVVLPCPPKKQEGTSGTHGFGKAHMFSVFFSQSQISVSSQYSSPRKHLNARHKFVGQTEFQGTAMGTGVEPVCALAALLMQLPADAPRKRGGWPSVGSLPSTEQIWMEF